MSTSKSHMYTANVWCCNMLNIVDVYFKVTNVYNIVDVYKCCNRFLLQSVYSKCVMLNVEYDRCLLQSHTCIQQMCDVVICSNIVDVYFKATHIRQMCDVLI